MNPKQEKSERREARDHTEILGETTLHLACTDVGSINTGSDNAISRTTASEGDAGSAGSALIQDHRWRGREDSRGGSSGRNATGTSLTTEGDNTCLNSEGRLVSRCCTTNNTNGVEGCRQG